MGTLAFNELILTWKFLSESFRANITDNYYLKSTKILSKNNELVAFSLALLQSLTENLAFSNPIGNSKCNNRFILTHLKTSTPPIGKPLTIVAKHSTFGVFRSPDTPLRILNTVSHNSKCTVYRESKPLQRDLKILKSRK